MDENLSPEQRARRVIDEQLEAAGWRVQGHRSMDLSHRFVAVREFPTATGPADYVLYADRKAIGTVEAKREGSTLRGAESQADRYADGFSKTAAEKSLPAWRTLEQILRDWLAEAKWDSFQQRDYDLPEDLRAELDQL